jgi:hypothetical protein
MAEPIGPGDFVECVNLTPDGSIFRDDLKLLRLRAIYRVVEVENSNNIPSVVLREVRSRYRTGAFKASHFRPVYRRNSTLIQSLLKPEKEDA